MCILYVVEKVWKLTGGIQEDNMSAEKFGRYTAEISRRKD